MVLTHGLRVFIDHPVITAIQVVIRPDDMDYYNQVMDELKGRTEKIYDPVFGGSTRQASVWNGLQALTRVLSGKTPGRILIHDAARPFVDAPLISRILKGLEAADAVIPGIRVADTLKRVRDHQVVDTIDRDSLYQIQTPQGFKFQHIYDAHRLALQKQDNKFTDDAEIAEHAGERILVVEGTPGNWKITDPCDLKRARQRLERNNRVAMASVRVGTGYDVHRFADENFGVESDNQPRSREAGIVLCGITVPHHRPLKGHSDADVGLHALTDAILGAIGDGDIGTHFPPSDPQWEGMSSDIFLRDAVQRVLKLGGTIEHVDVTLVCESPRIAPFRTNMVERIAEILNIEPSRVSVKATTTEGLGFTGRREGVAALASATIAI